MIIIKKIIIVFSFILIGLSIWYWNSYSPKSFNSILNLNDLEKIEFQWKDEINIVDNPEQIKKIIFYLNSFEYKKKSKQEISQENLNNNSYSLLEVWFIKSNSKKINISFNKDELRVGKAFYSIDDGSIDENTFRSLITE